MSYSELHGGPAPRILVLAGPNGSGKSTVTKKIPPVGLYVNADQIQRNKGCSSLEAAQEAEQIRNILLDAKADFTFETVLSTDRNLALLRRAKEAGYQIIAVFVLTKDPRINVERVKARVQGGGHDVPAEKIVSRYEKSLQNLKHLIRIADYTKVLDNSGETPSLICEVSGTSATVRPSQYWSKSEVLDLIYLK